MELFAIHCPTCNARLKVRDMAAIGMILNCPKCGSMVQVAAPPGWQPPPETIAAKLPRWQDEVPRGESPAGASAASTPVAPGLVPGSASLTPSISPAGSDAQGTAYRGR
ncbi:MAG TPA: hypothetical protein VF306_02590, partial [Pirellulales bacterium]